jgi:hypothetical protein
MVLLKPRAATSKKPLATALSMIKVRPEAPIACEQSIIGSNNDQHGRLQGTLLSKPITLAGIATAAANVSPITIFHDFLP